MSRAHHLGHEQIAFVADGADNLVPAGTQLAAQAADLHVDRAVIGVRIRAARGPDSDAYDRAIDVQVSRLRRKLRSGGDEIIRTVRNEGYLFVPKVVRA